MNMLLTVGSAEELTAAIAYCIHHDAWKHAEEQLKVSMGRQL